MTAEQKNPGVRTAEQTEAAKRRAVLVFSVLGLLAVGTVLLLAYLRGKPVIEISAEEFYFENKCGVRTNFRAVSMLSIS